MKVKLFMFIFKRLIMRDILYPFELHGHAKLVAGKVTSYTLVIYIFLCGCLIA